MVLACILMHLFMGGSIAQAADDGAAAGQDISVKKEAAVKDELAEKLVRQATGQEDGDVMARVMALMDRSRQRLAESNDGGEATQSLQRDIVKELDAAIEQALAQRKPQPKSQKGQSSKDKRNMPKPQDVNQQAEAAENEGGQPGANDRPTESVEGDAQRSSLLGELGESRRSWGNLPERDREEIIQGADQEILERYRSVIERYYRTLAESEDDK